MVYRWRFAFAVLIILVAGCATGDGREDDITIGWYCGGQGGDPQWQCERRPMRHGRPVDDTPFVSDQAVVPPPVVASADPPATDSADRSRGRQRPAAPHNRDWRQQLPALDHIPEPDGPADPVALVHQMTSGKADADRPLPQPEPAFERWGDEPLPDLDMADQSRPLSREDSSVATPGLADKPARGGYTVQLGAFSRADGRSRFVAENGLADLPLRFHHLSRDGRDWWLVTYGHFDSREAAVRDWQRRSRTLPGLEVWVRPWPGE